MKKLFIGFEGDFDGEGMKVVDTDKIRKQIGKLKGYELDLHSPDTKEPLKWRELHDETEQRDRLVLNAIIMDREKRVDDNMLMANRPPLAIFTIRNEKIVRFEFYEGHDRLSLYYDIRHKEDYNKDIEPSYKGG